MLKLNFTSQEINKEDFLIMLDNIILKKFILKDYELNFINFYKIIPSSLEEEKIITSLKTMTKYSSFISIQDEVSSDIKLRIYWYLSIFRNFFEDSKMDKTKTAENIIEIYQTINNYSKTEISKKIKEKINKSFKTIFDKMDEDNQLDFEQNLFFLYSPYLLNLRPPEIF